MARNGINCSPENPNGNKRCPHCGKLGHTEEPFWALRKEEMPKVNVVLMEVYDEETDESSSGYE